ncbi:homeobox protein Hox-C9a isoform X2 [Siniperca chuatsi]|uniref:homeobox protein Hox-C9a isoform X2 n=1 Tax=Siniperca chuatsi TaxID=119488 RepID=UPI001CE090BD|nr:homeobox protein Hox-C9a isoform X2 [Siniperca chuatsi]
MSTTGPISNYYVDSLINHENEDVLTATRFSAPGSHPAGPRPTSLVPECADYPSCSFAPKPPVFSTSWAPVHSQSSVVYHPYTHQPHLGTDSRYMRSWLEPISGAVPFHGYPGNSRHYGLKPDAFQEHRAGECLGSSGRTYTDYLYCSSTDMRDKTPQNIPSPESELLVSGKHKDEKPELDPTPSDEYTELLSNQNPHFLNAKHIIQWQIGYMPAPRGRSDALTQSTRLSNWKRSFCSICTLLETADSRSLGS